MCLRKLSAPFFACLILILLIPALFDAVVCADPGKRAHGKAIIVQPGQEVVVTDTASGPSPQEAEATALDARRGKSHVLNNGTVRAGAEADTTATAKGALAGARSVGINGSAGSDSLVNNGTLASKADAAVTSFTLFVNIDGFTLPFMRKFPPVNGGSLAESFAAGILGGSGDDAIEHSGIMTVEATSTAAAGNIQVNLAGRDEKVLSKAIPAVWAVKPPVMKADAPGKAASEAVGIDGGPGNDSIRSVSPITVAASAVSGAGSLGVNLGNDARANLSAEASATATGIRANDGHDEIINQGTVRVEASAVAAAGAITAAYPTDRGIYGLPVQPPARSKVQSPYFTVQGDLSGRASAEAAGQSGNAGDDHILNTAPVDVAAAAITGAGSVSVGVGTGAEANVSAEAVSGAAGIRGGEGNDTIRNEGTLSVDASSIAGAGSIGVVVSGGIEGKAAAKADASGKATADAVGISGDSGHDTVINIAPVTASASSTVGAGSISVGVATGAEADVSADATAGAAGIRGGEGSDAIRNEGALRAQASAIAVAGSIGVGVSGGEGESAPVKADASATTGTEALGIGGGEGRDAIVNIAPATVTASASTWAGSISVGVGTGAEADISAEAAARAAGIRGGEGNDAIRNEGTLTVEAASIAGAGSIAVGVSNSDDQENQAENPSVPAASEDSEASPAKADASAKATATASGITGGPGHDAIANIAPVDVTASATTGAGSISVGVGTGAEANVSAESIARAAGIRGGEGSDTIRNEGALTVEARAVAGAGSIAVGVKSGGGDDQKNTAETSTAQEETSETSAAKADASAKATAEALGIGGGAGDDAIVNIAPVSVKAASTVGAGSIAVGVGMGAEGNVSAEATTRAAGIRGGGGNDSIRNEGTLTVEAKSIVGAGSIAVGVSGSGEEESADAKTDASGKAKAAAVGISGGSGSDSLVNIGPLNVKASSTVGAGSIGVSVGGDVEGNVSAEAAARAAGIRGGDGSDEIVNQGALTVDAKSIAVAGSISVGVKSDDGDDQEKPPAPPKLETSSVKADAKAQTMAAAAGIEGGEGNNRIINTAPITVTSTATTVAGSIAVNVSGLGGGGNEGQEPPAGEKPETPALELSSAKTDASAKAESRGIGINAGSGSDTIASGGDISVEATSTAVAAGVSVNVAKVDKGLSGSAALADAGATATSNAAGIESGDGDNGITNSAAIGAKAAATAVGVGVSVDVGIAEKGATLGAAIADSSTTADALATGIRSGAGQDRVVNTGVITPDAAANATAVSVALTVTNADKGLVASAALADANATATATARGIETGAGDDVIVNAGAIAPKAKAGTAAVGVSVGVGVTEQGVSLGASLVESNASSATAAVGIDSGKGNDRVSNIGQIALDAQSGATAVSVGLAVTYAKQGVGVSAAIVDAQSAAEATARGIEAGDGDDRITNSGTIQGIAKADTTSVGVTVGVGIAKQGVAAGVGLSDTSTIARASAVGIDGGRGDDRIVNEGEIKLGLDSGFGSVGDADAVSVTVTVAGASQGLAGAAALSKSSSTGAAQTTGIYGGEGNDKIRNAGKIDVGAKAEVDSTNVAVGVTIAKEGLAGGAALSDSSALATASARGIDGAEGDDRIVNTGEIKSRAESRADTVSVTATIAGAKTGLAGGAALSDASALATAEARGIEGAAGADRIFNESLVDTKAEAYADTTNVTVTIAGASTGLAGGAALSDTTSVSVADAAGLSGGEGNDRISNKGKIVSGALADADATGVIATLTVAKEGLAAGAALSDTSSSAVSSSRGIDGGSGDDWIYNGEKIESKAEAYADTVSVTATISGTKTGVAGGASLSDSSALTVAAARGIEGGAGHDRIRNEGEIDAKAISGADTTSVTVTVNGSLTGVAGGAALSDASAASLSDASGISGGDGGDEIANTAKISAQATSDVDATAVTVTLSVTKEGVAGGAALSDTSSSAVSAARGIDGGAGSDRIWNEGVTEATSNASADTVSVSVQVAGSLYGAAGGVSMSDSSAAALAQSTGILGGTGDDVIVNSSTVTARSTADVHATSVSATVSGSIGLAAGAAFSDASVDSRAESRGINGGDGSDVIVNTGDVASAAGATGKSTSVSVNVALGAGGGATFSDSSALVSADASGIDGGAGHDRIVNTGPVTANASSDADVSSVSVTVGAAVSAGASFGDASVVSNVAARGIAGGEGNDGIYNEGKIISGAMSRVDADSVSVNVGMGWAQATTAVSSVTTASGIEGGGGDDRIVNKGEIRVGPSPGLDPWMSRVTASSFSFNLAGVANARSSMLATTKSTGIDGGDGNDKICNEGLLNVRANSISSVSADSVIVFGTSSGAVLAGAVAEAQGITGGAGDDAVANAAAITANSAATVNLDNSAFSFGGTGNTGGLLAGTARSTGINGGDGSDFIRNDGSLSLTATAALTSTSDADVAFGTSGAGSTSGALAEAAGISGGAGNDAIANTAAITANTAASVLLDSSSFSFGGTGDTGGQLTATARSTGISGGDGSDFIRNDGGLSLTATAALTNTSSADVAFGSSDAGSTSGAVAEAAGISGGAGNDAIVNTGTITANTTASVLLDSSSFSFGGTGNTGGQLTATARSTGISGGDGSDFIRNDGDLSLTAAAALTSRANADVAFGSSGAGSASGAVAEATGISGGAGDDRIENNASIRLTPSSTLTVTSSSFSFGGTGTSGTTLAATTSAAGISGGDGADLILNRGPITLQAGSTLTTGSSSDAAFGTSSGTVISGGVSQAVGIDGGAGNDRIFNAGELVVGSSSTLELKASGFTFGGTSGAQDTLTADSQSVGISGGAGANRIYSEGALTVTASSSLTAKADVDAAFGATVTYGTTSADSKATGISGGEKGDCIENLSDLTVTALSGAEIGKSTYVFGGTASSNGQAAAAARAEGIAAGDGDNRILNDLGGTVTVKAESTAKQSGSSTVTFGPPAAGADAKAAAFATGIIGGSGNDWIVNSGTLKVDAYANADGGASAGAFWGSPRAIVNARAEATATGIDVGVGNNVIVNDGQLTVTAEAEASSRAWAEEDAGDLATEEARATAIAASTARGIITGDGDNFIVNNGSINVTATATPTAVAETEDNDVERRNPSGTARAWGIQTGSGNDGIVIGEQGSLQVNALGQTATVLTGLSAVGIDAGAGHNRLILLGSAAVTASQADAVGLMAAGDVSALGIQTAAGNDSIAIANTGSLTVDALATGSVLFGGSGQTSAAGIDAGHGNNVILSDGAIGVRSISFSGSMGGAEATASGIRTGDGLDRIENRGTLSVFTEATTAIGSSDASAAGIEAGRGDNTIRNDGTIDVTARAAVVIGSARARAYGILTGDGNDTVTNAGSIRTSQTGIATGVSIETPGVAISTGGGSDRVTLEAGSLTRGIIDLGSGDDTIAFNGSLAVTGTVTGGAGSDTLVFSGDGALGAPLSGFEAAVKEAAGTYAVTSLAQVRRLEMNGGTLAVAHGYQMPSDGVFQARVNSDGSHGRFAVGGVAGLDGALNVLRGKGVYADGTRYPILTANTVNGWFTSETLPAPVPLLSFSVAGFSDRVEVEAHTKSCTTVATNPVQMRIAQMLDKAMATATGKTAEMLGEFQALPAQDFQKAFASLNPGTYDRFRKTSLTASRENIRSLHNRMTALRLTDPHYSAAVQSRAFANTMSLFKTGPDSGVDSDQAWQLGRISSAETRQGSWMSAFGQRGGDAGYDYRMNGTVLGYDQRHSETLFTGISSGFSRGHVGLEDRMASGSIDGASSSIYGSWFTGGTYVESALSMARNHYENRRGITVGSLAQSAAAEHEGNLFTAYASSGRYIDVNRWVIEPYASLFFSQVYEEGFQESGGGLSLRVHDDRSRMLVSDVGLRVARSFDVPFGALIPEAGVAWNYDFRLDDRSVTASLVGVDGSEFSIPGEQTGRHGARFEAGLSWHGASGFAASLKYTGEFRSGADDQGVFGYLRYEF